MDIPDNIINKALYKSVKEEAKKKYARPGLYRSAWIQKTYKEKGGSYKEDKPPSSQGIQRWLKKEQWIAVLPYLLKGEVIQCGADDGKNIACRPLIRATADTPPTLPELLKIHTRAKLIKLAMEKEKNKTKRINWKAGTIG